MQPDLNYEELDNKMVIVTASITVMHKKRFQQQTWQYCGTDFKNSISKYFQLPGGWMWSTTSLKNFPENTFINIAWML